MIPASARLHAAIVEQRLTLPDDPELARHASDAIARAEPINTPANFVNRCANWRLGSRLDSVSRTCVDQTPIGCSSLITTPQDDGTSVMSSGARGSSSRGRPRTALA